MKTREEIKQIRIRAEKREAEALEITRGIRLTDNVYDYLTPAVNRLFDVMDALYSLKVVVNIEKRGLIQQGQSFAYQQGILDIVDELYDYASGERSLKEEVKDIRDNRINEAEENKGDVEGYN